MRHNLIDPYTPERGYYECRGCTHREASEDRLTACSICGADVRNLAVPRE
ncbi:rubrerythrin-like domain-containing protein [Haloplanus salinus]|uniref:Rubrerythrin-like domain-containing protein n=1 Tax=Haloplanus salinus TaxID=1126245 RepID=A0A368NEZ6_9EURY|nr:rubrerythrin-like domain-containing protein [Haloplanus salinus]RCU48011.1 rubrerythrin-like domain-containing protein [Haloplanus salinus]